MGVTGAREARAGGFYFVDSSSDDANVIGCVDGVFGNCSLRSAIILANTDPGSKSIFFQGVVGVAPLAQLPDITAPVTIDGTLGGTARVIISGAIALGDPDGLRLVNHSGSTIKNMVINGWTFGAGISITGGGTHTIVGNLIGTDHPGTTAVPNSNGVHLVNTTNNTIGGAGVNANLISGNLLDGVLMEGVTDNTVAGNTIGLSLDETTAVGNGFSGVTVRGSGNQVGVSGLRNIIAGNLGNGVNINGPDNRVQFNLLGNNSLGQAKPNGAHGVRIAYTTGPIIIGGSLQNANTISGNARSGVSIEASADVEVSGNVIGLNADGNAGLPNGENGIEVIDPYDSNGVTTAGVSDIEIGKPGAGNLISGNTGDGIVIRDVNGVSVRANDIGVNVNRTPGVPNGLYGINIANANGNVIGGPADDDGNFIAGHSGAGIFIDGRLGDADGNEILNNIVGGLGNVTGNAVGIQVIADQTDITDNTIVRNTFDGITLDGNGNRGSGNLIGTNSDGDEVGNGGHGVTVGGDGNLISNEITLAAQPVGGPAFPLGANIIWNNGGSGVFVVYGAGNTINQNSMRDNAGGAIDLSPQGPNPNDTDDPDIGSNTLQNYPVLTTAGQSPAFTQGNHPSGGGGFLEGSLNSTPNTEFIIDVYQQPLCNASSPQTAEEWIGSFEVTTNGNGDVEFTQAAFTDMEPGDFVNATATNPTGSTSELSACIQVSGTVPTPSPTPSATPSPTPTPGPTGTLTPTPVPTDVFGDADCDEDVDMDDFIAVLSEVAGVPPGAPCDENIGCEDPIDAQDALDILAYMASPADFPLPPC
jgi:hypothetical protein